MSGPVYPQPPAPGSNGIGQFIIGVSPIGTIVPFNIWSTIISQYANSTRLTTLIENFASNLDQTIDMEMFFDMIWNINTAQGYGLDVWGKIVGISRILRLVGDINYFGFEEAGLGAETFGFGSFYVGDPTTSNFSLADPSYKTLIFAKAAANITDGSTKSINSILRSLFPNRGNAYVIDNLDMTMDYKFEFVLTAVERAIVEQSGVLPKPVGVRANVIQI